jgi:hypothetical protein
MHSLCILYNMIALKHASMTPQLHNSNIARFQRAGVAPRSWVAQGTQAACVFPADSTKLLLN